MERLSANPIAIEDGHASLEPFLNHVIQGEALETLATLPAHSIPLIITDLPYIDVLSDASEDEGAYLSYLGWMRECLRHLYRIGTPDCRLCLNVPAERGTNGVTYSLYSDILQLAKQEGWQYKSDITWYQPVYRRSALGTGTASAPQIVNPVERIMIFYKHHWERREHGVSHRGAESAHLAYGLWSIEPDDTQDASPHLTRLPLQIPRNVLQLLSTREDVVLDPFGSAGSVAVAAKQLGRKFILIAPDAQECTLARERLLRDVYVA